MTRTRQDQLRLSVEGAESQVLDTETREIVVPDLTSAQPLMGTPAVFRARTAREFQQLRTATDVVPLAGREFNRIEHLLIRVPTYGPGGTTPTLRARLLNRSGSPMNDLQVEPAPASGEQQISTSRWRRCHPANMSSRSAPETRTETEGAVRFPCDRLMRCRAVAVCSSLPRATAGRFAAIHRSRSQAAVGIRNPQSAIRNRSRLSHRRRASTRAAGPSTIWRPPISSCAKRVDWLPLESVRLVRAVELRRGRAGAHREAADTPGGGQRRRALFAIFARIST